nr:hypothetical protein Iba_chr10fCG4900 [Ipomoea batatas]
MEKRIFSTWPGWGPRPASASNQTFPGRGVAGVRLMGLDSSNYCSSLYSSLASLYSSQSLQFPTMALTCKDGEASSRELPTDYVSHTSAKQSHQNQSFVERPPVYSSKALSQLQLGLSWPQGGEGSSHIDRAPRTSQGKPKPAASPSAHSLSLTRCEGETSFGNPTLKRARCCVPELRLRTRRGLAWLLCAVGSRRNELLLFSPE